MIGRLAFYDLLDALDHAGPKRASETGVFMLTLLRKLSAEERAQTMEFLLEYGNRRDFSLASKPCRRAK
jgi:hypothetical protein